MASTSAALLGAAALVALAPSPARADAAAAGRAKAMQACSACHGVNGMSMQPEAPNLAGQPAVYLVAQLKAFRSGKRTNEVMSLMAKPLTDDEIDALAAWFSSIKVTATTP